MYNPILDFDDIPLYKLVEDSHNNKLCNKYSQKFIRRFGTMRKRTPINDQISSNNFNDHLEKKSIISYMNGIPNINTFVEFHRNRKAIYKGMLKKYSDKLIRIFSLCRYIQIFSLLLLYGDPFNMKRRILCNSIIQYARMINQTNQTIRYNTNIQSDKYISFDHLCNQRDSLKDRFDNWLCSHNDHMRYLKLCVNTYYPPLRLEMRDMRYIISDTTPLNNPNDLNNYLVRVDNILYIVLNHDKVVNRMGQQIYCLDQDNQYMRCSELTDIIIRSFELCERSFLFTSEDHPDRPLSESSYHLLLQCGQNILRQSYHTYYEKIHKPHLTNNQLNDIALRMRHSLATARQIYVKVPNMQPPENNRPDGKDEKEYRRQYNQRYFKKGSYGSIRQSDNRYLSYLMKKMITNPSDKKLLLHGIHLVDGVYEFTQEKQTERLNN